ncbi:hypothetical protein FRX31_011817 [Thalictrum thalictroides]|uniref:Uncharacterized protein n=1 Tax=Thalictrum thalictroides TaxID=46969 RepID=A0A7J6WMK1_THATH|nr:hypothetical protein FRX31_011817 [Thalictrum thalictroides]
MNLLVRKLKILKSRLIEWAKNNCSLLHKRVEEARKELFNIQKALHDNPLSVGLVVREKQILNKYGNLARAEMVSLKMKASCDWLCFGDRGTTYFHNAIKEKRSRNAIWSISNQQGLKVSTQPEIAREFVQFFSGLMGSDSPASFPDDFFNTMEVRNEVSADMALFLESDIEDEEIKTALFDMGDVKSPVDACEDLASILHVQHVRPPVTYLGIPLTASRLVDYFCVTAFHIYWSQTFILLTTVLDSLAKKGAIFLWNGTSMGRKLHQAKLSTICLRKEEGGLGISNMKIWNQAAYLGLVFKIAAKGSSGSMGLGTSFEEQVLLDNENSCRLLMGVEMCA